MITGDQAFRLHDGFYSPGSLSALVLRIILFLQYFENRGKCPGESDAPVTSRFLFPSDLMTASPEALLAFAIRTFTVNCPVGMNALILH